MSQSTRRPRPATACVACRNRRIRCDRSKPSCSECNRRGQSCEYAEMGIPSSPFVLDSRVSLANPADSGSFTRPQNSDRLPIVRDGNSRTKAVTSGNIGAPFWELAEADENTKASRTQLQEASIQVFVNQSYVWTEEVASIFAASFPSLQDRALYLQAFLLNVHPLMAICHTQTLQRDLSSFMTCVWPRASTTSLVLALAVFYAGACTTYDQHALEQANAMYYLFEKVLHGVDFSVSYGASSLQLLQGYLIMHTFRASQHDPLSEFGFLAEGVRFAQLLGLHVNDEEGDQILIEIRRRIWWHLVFLDVEMSIANGLPGLIHEDEYDTKMPSHLLDQEHIVQNNSLTQGMTRQDGYEMVIAVQMRWKWAEKMKQWMKQAPLQEEVLEFTQSIRYSLDGLAENDQNVWYRGYLKLQIDRTFCVLGPKFWGQESLKNADCDSSFLNSARSFLETYLQLSMLSPKMGHQWFIPGFIHPLHALMALLVHLRGCSKLDTEARLRRDLINMVVALQVLRSARGATSTVRAIIRWGENPEKSNPMYCLLWNLRQLVWNKAGWLIPKDELEATTTSRAACLGALSSTAPLEDAYEVQSCVNNHEEQMPFQSFDELFMFEELNDFHWDNWTMFAG